jgi:hypothetical protein
VVLQGHRCAAEHQAEEHDGRQGGCSPGGAAHGLAPRRQGIFGGASQGAAQVHEDVQSEEYEPDHRRRAMGAASGLEGVPVEEPHGDAAAEENDGRCDEQWCKQSHRYLRRAKGAVGAAARVIARESPPGARQLQQHRRDQGETDEHVQRHERVHAEQDGRDLDEDRHDHEQPDGRRQAFVAGGVHPTFATLSWSHRPLHRGRSVPYFNGTPMGPGRRR